MQKKNQKKLRRRFRVKKRPVILRKHLTQHTGYLYLVAGPPLFLCLGPSSSYRVRSFRIALEKTKKKTFLGCYYGGRGTHFLAYYFSERGRALSLPQHNPNVLLRYYCSYFLANLSHAMPLLVSGFAVSLLGEMSSASSQQGLRKKQHGARPLQWNVSKLKPLFVDAVYPII